MAKIGFHAAHELYSPSTLLRLVKRAEQLGFQSASCSDHFHPWSDRHSHSGFAWSWLGAALEATSLSAGCVCAPGQRYHPAVIAQAAATLLEMYPGRFWLCVGSGEALNERITGDAWPEKPQRNARLKEAVDVMRALWRGETVTHDGLVRVEKATLYTRPASAPLLVGAALTPETAKWLGGWADGLLTAGAHHDDLRQIVDAFREGGGEGKPVFLQAAISYGQSDEEAISGAFERWRHAGLDLTQLADLATPRDFDDAGATVTKDGLAESLRCSADLNQHIDWLRRDFELGFEAVYLHHVGRDIERFLETFAEHVLPELGLESPRARSA